MPSTRAPNAYYVNPSLGGAFNSLAALAAGDDNAGLSRDALNYATARNRDAETAKVAEEARQLQDASTTAAGMGDRLAKIFMQEAQGPQPSGQAGYQAWRRPDEIRQGLISESGNIARQFPGKSAAFGDVLSAYLPMSGDEGNARIGLTVGGKQPGKDYALTTERADTISARDAAEQKMLEDVRQAGATGRTNIEQTGANARNAATLASQQQIEQNKPVNLAPGNLALLPPKHFATTPENQGRVQAPARPETTDQVLAQALQAGATQEDLFGLAKAKVAAGSNQNAMNTEGKLRDDFNQLPSVKGFRASQPIYESMKQSEMVDNRSAHLDLVYGLAKIMDPESVVREGEMATVMKSATIPDNIKAAVSKVAGGAVLTPETRRQIVQLAGRRMAQLQGSHDYMANQFRDIATRSGANPANVVVDVTQRPNVGGPTAGVQETKVINGVTYTKINGTWHGP